MHTVTAHSPESDTLNRKPQGEKGTAHSVDQRLAEMEKALAVLSAEVARLTSPQDESQPSQPKQPAEGLLDEQQTDLESQRGATDDAVAELTRQRDELLARVAAAEEAAAKSTIADDKMYEMQRRFEMAVEDMRTYKQRVEELEEQLAQRPQAIEKPAATGGPMGWAEQKARMLASLETDMAGEDKQNDRLTVEGAVRITDEVVAEKDREIERLKRQMEDLRSERVVAIHHDAEVADVLDHDAVIATERERLHKLQEALLDKQRSAEVELAVERAKLARLRTEVDERQLALESDLAKRPGSGDSAAGGSAKPARGRWLARLGLKDDN